MRSSKVSVIAVAFVLVSVSTAFPNGIDPPRPAGASAVTTVCKDKQNNVKEEIYRTQIKYGNKRTRKIESRIGDKAEQLPLSGIKSITLGGPSAHADGFAKAALVRSDDTEEKKVMIRVSRGDRKLRLSGFRRDGAAVTIDLMSCKSIEFLPGTAAPKNSGPPAMKH